MLARFETVPLHHDIRFGHSEDVHAPLVFRIVARGGLVIGGEGGLHFVIKSGL